MTVSADEYMLTTTDNPWNPWTHYDEWYAWDYAKGYHTPSYLARICMTSNDLSDADQSLDVQNAINEIVKLNILGIYIRIRKEDQIKIPPG